MRIESYITRSYNSNLSYAFHFLSSQQRIVMISH